MHQGSPKRHLRCRNCCHPRLLKLLFGPNSGGCCVQLLPQSQIRFFEQALFTEYRLQAQWTILYDRHCGCVNVIDRCFNAGDDVQPDCELTS